jgi:hypothetical protein
MNRRIALISFSAISLLYVQAAHAEWMMTPNPTPGRVYAKRADGTGDCSREGGIYVNSGWINPGYGNGTNVMTVLPTGMNWPFGTMPGQTSLPGSLPDDTPLGLVEIMPGDFVSWYRSAIVPHFVPTCTESPAGTGLGSGGVYGLPPMPIQPPPTPVPPPPTSEDPLCTWIYYFGSWHLQCGEPTLLDPGLTGVTGGGGPYIP